MAKKVPEWRIEPWWTKRQLKSGYTERYYVWKKDKRAKKSGGWRLFDVGATVDELMKIITGRKR